MLPSTPGNNSAHVSHYGLRTDFLTGPAQPASGGSVSETIGGVHAGNVSTPPTVSQMHQHPVTGKSGKSHGSGRITKGTMAKSRQNTWAAQETLAKAQATSACSGQSGSSLLSCAQGYQRHLGASPPALSSDRTCDDLVYNRYYDIERWMDQTNACAGDPECQAAITLDPNTGIVGKILTGSDIPPGSRDIFKSAAESAFGSPPTPLPSCGNTNLTPGQLHACELIKSMPPLAHIHPTYTGPMGGTGTAYAWQWADGHMVTTVGQYGGLCLGGSPCSTVGYSASKNPFYDGSPVISPMVVAAFASNPAKAASMQRLVAELARGSQWAYVGRYQGGHAPGTHRVSYSDEWDYDRAGMKALQGVSTHTLQEYAKHREHVTQRARTFGVLYSNAVAATLNSQLKFAIPASVVDANLTGPGSSIAAARHTGPVLGPDAQSQTMSGMEADPSLSGKLGALGSPPPPQPTQVEQYVWSQQKPQMDAAYAYPRLQCGAPDRLENGVSERGTELGPLRGTAPLTIGGPPIDGTPAPSAMTTAACNYINAILDEWARNDSPTLVDTKDKNPPPGPTGCFANDPACDWDPATFMSSMRDMVQFQISNVQHARREADYKFCKAWDPVVASKRGHYPDQSQGETNLLADMKQELQSDYDKISKVPVIEKGGTWPSSAASWAHQLDHVKPEKGDSFSTFGEDRQNAEQWGNSLFGVGYSYDLGWEIPVRWEQVQPNKQYPGWAVCDLGVGAHAGFDSYAYAFGSDKFDIISADLAAGINDYTNPSVPGDPDTSVDQELHDGVFDADLTIAGDSLVTENLPMHANQTQSFPVAQGSNSWTLFTIPFQISFVTLEISVGVGYSYGVNVTVTPTHKDTCHQGTQSNGVWPTPGPGQLPSVGINAGLQPQGELDGIVQAYASLAGLAGVGIQVDLTLLGIGLPLDNSLTLDPNNLTLASSLNMDMHTLDGSLSVYAELLFVQLFDIEILSWSGIHDTIPLLNTSTSVQMPALNGIGGTGLTNPASSLAGL
jgi:hypothetical protein